MKKVEIFIRDSIKALLGSFILIGIMEVFNVLISIEMGSYVRVDRGILEEVVENYSIFSIFGYSTALGSILFKRIMKDEEKDILQRFKEVTLTTCWISIIAVGLISIVESNFKIFLFGSSRIFVMYIAVIVICYLLDKKNIKKINEKIKEKNNSKQEL